MNKILLSAVIFALFLPFNVKASETKEKAQFEQTLKKTLSVETKPTKESSEMRQIKKLRVKVKEMNKKIEKLYKIKKLKQQIARLKQKK